MGICKTEIICLVRFVPLWSFLAVLFLLKLVHLLIKRLFARARFSSGARLQARVMASAASLPLRALAPAVAALLGAGAYASRAQIKSFLTGPGSYSRILVLVLLGANVKNLPFVWHVRTIPLPALRKLTSADSSMESHSATYDPLTSFHIFE